MAKSTFLVVQATPNPENMEDLQKYGSQSYDILAKHGGVPVANYNVDAVMDSGEKPAMVGVFSFPSPQAIEDLLVNDPDYQKLVPFRDKGFKNMRFLVCSTET
jgi:uncharacterized protein (DUF1330 family)